MSQASGRIRKWFQSWYITEPVLFAVVHTHELRRNDKIKTMRVGRRRIEYNEKWIMGLTDEELKLHLTFEGFRVLLKHPYERAKPNPIANFTGSNVTLQEHLSSSLEMPKAKNLFVELLESNQTEQQKQFLEAYKELSELDDSELLKITGMSRSKLESIKNSIPNLTEEDINKKSFEYYYGLLDSHLDKALQNPHFQKIKKMIEEALKNQQKQQCQTCQGTGKKQKEPQEGEEEQKKKDCPNCNNAGQVPKEESQDSDGEEKEQETQPCPDCNGEGQEESDQESDGVDGQGEGEGNEEGDEPCPDCNGTGHEHGEGGEPGGGEGEPTSGDHFDPTNALEETGLWDSDELLKSELNDAIQRAQATNSWGNIGGKMQDELIASLKPKLDYRSILRQFRSSVLSSHTVINRMRPSRRYGFGFPGKKRDFSTRLAFFVDVSGSMSDVTLQTGFGAINSFFKYGVAESHVFQFDTEIKDEKPPKITTAKPKFDIIGRGGTDFQCIFNQLDKMKKSGVNYDGVIIFTDGWAPRPKIPKGLRTGNVLFLYDCEKNWVSAKGNIAGIGKSAFMKSDKEY